MTKSILINVTREETRVALLEGGQVIEVYIERQRSQSLVGNIYKGRVVKVLPGMQSAFVDVGLEKAAFLHVGDISTDVIEDYTDLFEDEDSAHDLEFMPHRRRQDLHIEDLIQEGQDLLVQISKDPLGSKGARVTSYVTIPGRHLVFMPGVEHIGISRRIGDEDERARLRAAIEAVKPPGVGLIVRTVSEGATAEDLKKDLEFLTQVWRNIIDRKDKTAAPALLYCDLSLILRSVRDLMGQDVGELVVDSLGEHDRIKEFVDAYFPRLSSKIELYNDTEPLFDFYGIEHDIARALGRKVWLKSGGYIVIDQTEAMTVIDVNTGKFVGKGDFEETILKTNIEAVKEIAYQIRLRNLGGIIIVDFIDMERPENRQKVLGAVQEAMSRDRAKCTISQISELGVIQMTRKRVRESLGRTLCETCPYCEGKGFVKSSRSLCYEIFRKVRRIAAQKARGIVITAHPSVAELLSDEERQEIEDIESLHSIKIIVAADPGIHQEDYSISAL